MRILFAALMIFLLTGVCRAETSGVSGTPGTSETTKANFFSDTGDSDVYSQLFSISAGPLSPRSAVITNGSYTFDYGSNASNSLMLEAGWSARLFWALGGVYFNENFAYSQFSGTAPVNSGNMSSDKSLSVNLLGLDTRIVHAWEWFPVHWIIPFVEGGYQYTFYSQAGSVDLDSVQGGVGNPVAGAGIRLWVNRALSETDDAVHRHNQLPIFLTVKWNRILPNTSNGLDLAESSYMAGLSIGL